MNPQTRMELTRELEKMRISPIVPNSRGLFILGTVAEIIAGAVLISLAIRFTIAAVSEDRLFWVGYSFVLLGIIALAHAGYMSFKRYLNRRLLPLYEAVLESSATPEG
jgi:hypothetical protein